MEAERGEIFVGCAGWSLPRASWPQFPADGSQLERYAARFNAVEINSSFYRPHRPQTYRRWADSVPASFRFAVKLPRRITHEQRLRNADPLLDDFLAQTGELGDKFGALLVQLPPSFGFDGPAAESFLQALRSRFTGDVVWEPRHASWFDTEATRLLQAWRIARVAADPAPVPAAAQPGAWPEVGYWRLHGSPRMYYSAYAPESLERLALALLAWQREGRRAWCVFDNTAEGASLANALFLRRRLQQARRL